jgi:ABC-2 type transport system ATP-binding protein
MNAIEISHVSKRYQMLRALDDVSIEVKQGEFFGLLGPNGAGKTTLISIMAGLAFADSGSIRIMGCDVIRDYRQTRRMLGVVPQEIVFDPFFTVRETLRIQSGFFGLKGNDSWIDEVMVSLGLEDKADVNTRALSGGMKRRLLVAQALVHRPPVIVLDEPTAGVDVELRQSLWQFIGRLNREGHTVVLTTHYLEEAQTWCNRIAMLKEGRVIALDSTEALIHQFSETQLVLQLGAELPQTLMPLVVKSQVTGQSGKWVLRIRHYAEIGRILAELGQCQVPVNALEVQEPDLEDVFLQLMETGRN